MYKQHFANDVQVSEEPDCRRSQCTLHIIRNIYCIRSLLSFPESYVGQRCVLLIAKSLLALVSVAEDIFQLLSVLLYNDRINIVRAELLVI